MAVRREKNITVEGSKYDVHMESYLSANEVVEDCKRRPVRISGYAIGDERIRDEWHGVNTYDEALTLLHDGYQSSVDSFRNELKVTPRDGTRFSFSNNIQGYAPVVPLALCHVPNSMLDMTMKPIKAKVLDVYYDMTSNCGTEPDEFVKAGKALLGSIIELEKQGYRFNLYAIQTYTSSDTIDVLCVKIKSSNKPLDLKRMSFPLTHPAFFRVIGFDWEGKSPVTRDIGSGRGHAIGYDLSGDGLKELSKQLFGDNACYLSCAKVIKSKYDRDVVKEAFLDVSNSK